MDRNDRHNLHSITFEEACCNCTLTALRRPELKLQPGDIEAVRTFLALVESHPEFTHDEALLFSAVLPQYNGAINLQLTELLVNKVKETLGRLVAPQGGGPLECCDLLIPYVFMWRHLFRYDYAEMGYLTAGSGAPAMGPVDAEFQVINRISFGAH